MRLLQKQEIDLQKSEERRKEIDEGIKLAKKVDTLRELASTEQNNLQKFRDATLDSIKEQVSQAYSSLEALRRQIETAEEEKKRLRMPLDQEWVKVNTAAKRVEQGVLECVQKQQELDRLITENVQKEHQNKIEESRILDERQRTTQLLVEADKTHRSAQDELKGAQEKSSIMNLALDFREKEVSSRERDITFRENQLKSNTEKIQKYEVDLMHREIALKDGWNTLQETAKELEQKYGRRI